MSKILKAMQKVSGSHDDFGIRLSSADQVNLFPPPPANQMAEFEQLVNSLIGHHREDQGEIVVFTSASSGEGTSFVSYNVARHLSILLDNKVAWIDGNFLSPNPKLDDDRLNFRNLLRDPRICEEFDLDGNLTLVANGSGKIKPTDLLRSGNYQQLLNFCRQNFYFTIIDAPPFLEAVEVAHLGAPALGVVVVIESRGLKHEIIKHGIDNLTKHGVEVLGAVLNKRVYDIPKFLYKRL